MITKSLRSKPLVDFINLNVSKINSIIYYVNQGFSRTHTDYLNDIYIRGVLYGSG